MRPTLQQNIVSSTLTLPLCSVACAVVWMLPDVRSASLWGGLAAATLTTYLLLEMVNRNQLLRIRSRMVSATFVCWLAACPFLHPLGWHFVPALAVAGSLFLLLSSYQEERAVHSVYHAFLLLSLGSAFFPPLICLVPLYYAAMSVQLRSMSWRALGASLLGVLTPLWFGLAWMLLSGQAEHVAAHFTPWLSYRLPDYGSLPPRFWVNAAFLLWQLLLGLTHYYRTNFNDKIRVRMCYYVIMLLEAAFVAGLFLFPDHFPTLYLLLILCGSPLVGHYYTLARGGAWMTAWFLQNLLLLIALGVYNHLL
ncbi:MAG: hypothetical protein IJ692_06160 [Alloprevotella sp.]|nr:hypothetical protein [Alloprevotella sp.]